MKMSVILTFCIYMTSCTYSEPVKVAGSTTYSRHESESLATKLDIEHKYILHKPAHERYLIYSGNKIIVDVDHFGNDLHVNPYTTIGIEF